MTLDRKRVNVEREDPSESESTKDVTNDSLGTVDPADSTGLDCDQPAGTNRPGNEDRD